VKIAFGPNADQSVVSAYTLRVIKELLGAAGETGALITSTARTPKDQARAMYDNLETSGVERQKKLYGGAGDKVIDAYVEAKKAKKTKPQILAAMEDKIEKLGPSRVSKHIADPSKLGVVDVAPSSIRNKKEFIKGVEGDKRVSLFLKPPNDPAYHLEIPQPASAGGKPEEAAQDEAAGAVAAPPKPVARAKPREERKTWVEFKVVEDGTARPVSGVRLSITPPDGIEKLHTTSSSGLIRLEEILPGSCTVKCDLKDARLSDTLHFVGAGEPKSGGNQQESSSALQAGHVRIAQIEVHKVKKGESIDKLAKAAGLTWKELSKFNWGTDVPDEINEHLRDVVGCTKKTKDGNNYMFDDSDQPGIIYIPTKWEQGGLATATRHVIRVSQPKVGTPLIFQMVEERSEMLLPRHDFVILDADGEEITRGRTDDDAIGRAQVPAEGEYTVTWGHGKSYTLRGTVFDGSAEKPLPNAVIEVRPTDAPARQVTAGAKGELTVDELPEGVVLLSHRGAEYAINISHDIDDAIIFLSASRAPDNDNGPDTWDDSLPELNRGTPTDPAPDINPDEF